MMGVFLIDLPKLAAQEPGELIARAPVGEPFLIRVEAGAPDAIALPTPIPEGANAAVITVRGPAGETTPDMNYGIWFRTSSPASAPTVDAATGAVVGERSYQGIPSEVTSRPELEALRVISASTQDALLLVQYYTAPRAVAVVNVGGDVTARDEVIRSSGATPPPNPTEPAIRQNSDSGAWEGWNVDTQTWVSIGDGSGQPVETEQIFDLFGAPVFQAVDDTP